MLIQNLEENTEEGRLVSARKTESGKWLLMNYRNPWDPQALNLSLFRRITYRPVLLCCDARQLFLS